MIDHPELTAPKPFSPSHKHPPPHARRHAISTPPRTAPTRPPHIHALPTCTTVPRDPSLPKLPTLLRTTYKNPAYRPPSHPHYNHSLALDSPPSAPTKTSRTPHPRTPFPTPHPPQRRGADATRVQPLCARLAPRVRCSDWASARHSSISARFSPEAGGRGGLWGCINNGYPPGCRCALRLTDHWSKNESNALRGGGFVGWLGVLVVGVDSWGRYITHHQRREAMFFLFTRFCIPSPSSFLCKTYCPSPNP